MPIVNVIPETLAQYVTIERAQLEAPQWAKDNGKWIKEILDKHNAWLQEEEVEKFQAAYDGYLESIDTREKSRGDDVNHKLLVNYAQLIIDTAVDYMTGKPIAWTVEDSEKEAAQQLVEEYRKEAVKLLKSEQARKTFAEWLRQGSIGGYSGVISWVDEKGQIDFEEFPVQEIIPIYDRRGRLVLVLRTYPVEDTDQEGNLVERVAVEVYDERYVTYYLSTDEGDEFELDEAELATGNPIEHKAGRIPVAIFTNGTPARYEKRNKKNGTSDLGNGVYTLLENLAATMSDKANTVDRLLDQFLLLIGVDTDENEVVKMRKARALTLRHENSKAEFLAPKQEDTAVENHLDRLLDTLHDTTQTPRLNDLSGATATEIKMKYAALDIKAGKKELYFTVAIRALIEIITDMLNYKRLVEAGLDADTIYSILSEETESSVPLYNAEWLGFTLNRNLPQNFKEIADIVASLVDKVPDTYLYELLWFIDDPVAAVEEMKKQRKERGEEQAQAGLNAMGFGGEFSNLDSQQGQGGNNNQGEFSQTGSDE